MTDFVIDTSAFIARAHRLDNHHRRAVEFLERHPPGSVFHYSNYIFDETLTRLRANAGHEIMAAFVRHMGTSRSHVLHQITEEMQAQALEMFLGQVGTDLSFTDCTTAALMRRLELTDIFTFDRDFTALGLTVRP